MKAPDESSTPSKEGAAQSLDASAMSTGPLASLGNYLKQNEKVHIAWCVTGIVGCLLLYGVLQERIIAEEYVGPSGEGEHFKATLFIVMCNRLVTCAVAVAMLFSTGQTIKPQAPLWNYAAVSGCAFNTLVCAASNVVATFCQYEALKYVSFPVQTLGKCAKMIPVMIWGSAVNGKTYKLKDYLVAVMVTAGCAMFAMTGQVTSKRSQNVLDSSLFGCMLMVGYLGFDGFTSTWQDKMFKGFSMSIYNQILYVQLCSALVSLTSLVMFGQLMPALAFLSRHPDCLWNIIILSVAATIAQLFISHTIKTFGALLFATVMTTRQFLSILLSCFLFLHPLSWGQTLATCIVFGALYYKNLSSQKKEAPKPSTAEEGQSLVGQTKQGAESAMENGQSALERLVAAGK